MHRDTDFVEEQEILEKKEAMDAAAGEQSVELSPIDARDGVYPKSFFDLGKYPTHWALVPVDDISSPVGRGSVDGKGFLDRINGREL